VAVIATVPYSIVRQPTDRNSGVLLLSLFLSHFFIAVRLLRRREKFTEPDSLCWRELSTE
jgi:hypothetical protein